MTIFFASCFFVVGLKADPAAISSGIKYMAAAAGTWMNMFDVLTDILACNLV